MMIPLNIKGKPMYCAAQRLRRNIIGCCILSVMLCWFIQPLYPQSGKTGVTMYNQEKTDDSYRLVSSRYLPAAHLIAPDGRYVHTWYYPNAELKPTGRTIFGMSWHYAEMLPNGNLVAVVKDEMIIELDWNSNLVWKAKCRAHHDFARTEEDNTLVISVRDIPHPFKSGATIAMDRLLEFNQDGELCWEWNFEDHSGEVEQMVNQPLWMMEKTSDWPHINTCEVLPENSSGKSDPRFKKGNILINGRHSNTAMIIDRESGQIVWAWGPGVLEGPHMPTMLPSGNILIYDNGSHTSETARKFTRILELNPLSGKIVWEFGEQTLNRFFSPSRGSSDRLPNGNTLIADSDNGRLFEVTPSGEMVWEYYTADITARGNRMPLYRTVPYSKELSESLLERFGKTIDLLPREKPEFDMETERSPNQPINEEVVSYLESGYYDHALRLVNGFMSRFPREPEGYWAYSLVYAVRKEKYIL